MNATGKLDSRLIPLAAEPAQVVAGLEFVTADSRTAHFVAMLGWDKEQLSPERTSWLTPGKIDLLLDKNAESICRSPPDRERPF